MKKEHSQIFSDAQPGLFDQGAVTPGSDNIGHLIRGLVTTACTQCRFSRDQIADRMTEYLGTRVTSRMLNAWTAESLEQHRFPLEYLIAFCRATETWALLALVVSKSGATMIGQREKDLISLGEAAARKELAEREFAFRFAAIGGVR